MLKIVKAPNSVLSQKTKPIIKIDKTVSRLIEEMIESMKSAKDPIGVGLAAPQVGKSLSIFIARPSQKSKVLIFINPQIEKYGEKKSDKTISLQMTEHHDIKKESTFDKKDQKKLEGCLSLLNIWGEVERFDNIWISYLDGIGKKHYRRFNGFTATIIQHEIDHLNGILFPKRVLEQKGTLYKSEKNEKGHDIFEEIKL